MRRIRRIVVGAFMSLDGVMQAPGGPDEDPIGGFKFGGWATTHFDEAMGAHVSEMMSRPFDLLLGRKTYDIFAAHWPYAPEGDPIGTLFDRIEKYVATRNPDMRFTWQKSRSLGPDAIDAVRRLKEEGGPDLLTQGSTDFLRSLLATELVDEINVSIFPVVLGRGKRLFGDTSMPSTFRLIGSSASPSGIVMNRYERAGEVVTGSFEFDNPTAVELERRRKLA